MIKYKKGGEGIEGWIQPTCECGWQGSEHYAHNDYQHTNAIEQYNEHKKTCWNEKQLDITATGGESVE